MSLKQITLYLTILFSEQLIFAQNIYFPYILRNDSQRLIENIPKLASAVISSYSNFDESSNLDDLFRLQIVAQDYSGSINTLKKFRNYEYSSDTLTGRAIGFQFESFCSTMKKTKDIKAFNLNYETELKRLLTDLHPKTIYRLTSYYLNDINSIQKNYTKLFDSLIKMRQDSIRFTFAKDLCRAFNSYNVYSKILEIGKIIIQNHPLNQYSLQDSVLIKMRDGAYVSAIIIKPKEILEKMPVIFQFNIYTGNIDRTTALEIYSNGYIGVVANTRGKKNSPNEIEPFEHDANDANDILDWISKQEWCNGKIGMYGGSYLGFAQWAAVKNVHPSLKTIVPQVAVGAGIDFPMIGNIFDLYSLRWIHYVSNSKNTDIADFSDGDKWYNLGLKGYKTGLSFNKLDSLEGRKNKTFQKWLSHPSYDSYWQKMTPQREEYSKINIPILTITGYFDGDQTGALHYLKQHYKHNKNANHYLLIGPYDHYGAQGTPSIKVGDYNIESSANINITNLTFQWFNYVLKDSTKPLILKDKINFNVMGKNKWRHVNTLRNMSNDTLKFFLSNVRISEHYALNTRKSFANEFIRQEVDLAYRFDTIGKGTNNVIDSVLNLENKITFITSPIQNEFEFNGAFLASLNFCINKKDIDIKARMYELRPDNTYFEIGSAIIRSSFSKDRSNRKLLVPNTKQNVKIENATITSKNITKGSQILFVLGVNKNSHYQINYGTGKDVSTESIKDAGEPLQIKWYNDSYIQIPVWRDK